MATIHPSPTVALEVKLNLNESEARALNAMCGYDEEAFLKFFYSSMGRAYLEPYESGLRSLFKFVRASLPVQLTRIDRARNVFNDAKPKQRWRLLDRDELLQSGDAKMHAGNGEMIPVDPQYVGNPAGTASYCRLE